MENATGVPGTRTAADLFAGPDAEPPTRARLLERHIEAAQVIQARHLIMEEARRLAATIADEEAFPVSTQRFSAEDAVRWAERLRECTLPLLSLFTVGCFWGGAVMDERWVEALNLVANPPRPTGSHWNDAADDMRLYPTLLLAYGGGLAALAGAQFGTLSALLNRVVVVRSSGYDRDTLAKTVVEQDILPDSVAVRLLGDVRSRTPASEHLRRVSRASLSDLLPNDDAYLECCDRFEYLTSLIRADAVERQGGRWERALSGAYALRTYGEKNIGDVLAQELAAAGDTWAPLRAGLFGGSAERFAFLKNGMDRHLESLRQHLRWR